MNTLFYIQDIYPLFEAVQKANLFEDQKTMPDAIPKFSVTEIMQKFDNIGSLTNKELQDFVLENFDIPNPSPPPAYNITHQLSIEAHIEKLWEELTRINSRPKGSLLTLPKSYIVPGGRFLEFFYWDSYYIMLGLQASGKIEMMKNIVENCAYLIHTYGFVPNASRSYFLSRSQPPYFSLMLDLLYESTKDDNIYIQYFNTLDQEYQFWMYEEEYLASKTAHKHVLKTKHGDILNRYFDEENTPRPESCSIDLADYRDTVGHDFYRNIRAACESGWDFSSRWFKDQKTIQSIQILNIAQVDLNCLLWHLEYTLGKTALQLHLNEKSDFYFAKAAKRKKAIQYYFWNEEKGIYTDYLFLEDKLSDSENIACLYPLFLGISDKKKAERVAKIVKDKFLKIGGLITTTIESGQQWDSPNAWAPYQWLGYTAMHNYGYDQLAEKIKTNWCSNVERIYHNTGKLMEKYNAMDTQSIAGGGEYPNQDGFGWTNGVYIKLKKL